MKNSRMLFLSPLLLFAAAAQGQVIIPSTDTNFTAASNAQINNENNWSAGLPTLTNVGEIAINGAFNSGLDGMVIVQSAGTTTSGFNRNFGAGTQYYLTGGSVLFYNAGADEFRNWNSATGGYSLFVTGGTFEVQTIQLTNNSQLYVSGGTMTMNSNLNNNSGTITFGPGGGTVTTPNMSNSDGVINFLPGAGGTLTVTAWAANNFEGLWNQGILRFDGGNAGAFSDHFQVDGSTLSLIPEPSTYAAIFGALVLGLAAWRRRQI